METTKINELIKEGNQFKAGITPINFENFCKWNSECMLYIERNYNGLELTNQYIKISKEVIELVVNNNQVDLNRINYLHGALQGVLNYEKLEEQKKAFDSSMIAQLGK
ncbi:hypothetical protein [Ectobacillus polymachus]|uniref:hypothetical protein n=1 Tax=Ectobacillus polymachus TaxID=1508806 RepID=UPI003A86AC3D